VILRRTLFVALLCAASAGYSRPVASSSHPVWPRFRGPNGTGIGVAPEVPSVWDDSAIRWSFDLPGKGHSSPVVWRDRLYVTSADAKKRELILSCLSAAGGSLLWEKRIPINPYRMNRDNSYAASTPCVDEERVYLYWATPKAVKVAAFTHGGRQVWCKDLGPYKSIHGGGVSPIAYKDLLIVPNDQQGQSFLIALSAATGSVKWRIGRKSGRAAYATPCVYRPAGGPAQLIFASTSCGLTGVDPESGKVIWEYPEAFPLRVVSSPIIADSLIVGTCGQGGLGRRLVALALAEQSTKPQLAYELTKSVPYVPTPLAKGKRLFLLADNGVASCVEARSGKLIWRQRLGDRFYSSFVCVGDRLFALSRKGRVFVLGAGDNFRLIAKFELPEGTHATPAVAGGFMYVRTFRRVFCVGPKAPSASGAPASDRSQ